jgi:hypothetical protein
LDWGPKKSWFTIFLILPAFTDYREQSGKLGLFFQTPFRRTQNVERSTKNLALFGFVFRQPKPLKIAMILINLCYQWINIILPILTLALFFQIVFF